MGFCSAESPWVPAWAAPTPGPVFLFRAFPCFVWGSFSGKSWVFGSSWCPLQDPFGDGTLCKAWSPVGPGSDRAVAGMHVGTEKAVLCPKRLSAVAVGAQSPSLQPFEHKVLVSSGRVCEKRRKGLVWGKGGGRQWGGRGGSPSPSPRSWASAHHVFSGHYQRFPLRPASLYLLSRAGLGSHQSFAPLVLRRFS